MFNPDEFTTRNLVYGNNGEGRKDFVWPAQDDYCWKLIMRDWQESSETILKHTPDRKVVLQAGGNAGLYPFLYGLNFQKVFTFEPDPVNFYCLSMNCHYANIVKFNTALGDKNEWVNLIPSPYFDNYGMASVSKEKEGLPVFCVTIDSLNLNELSLIHLDVEGFELNILKGAKKTINKLRPTVVAEAFDDNELKQIINFMNKMDYIDAKIFSGPNPSDPANVIFIPREREVHETSST